MKKVTTVSFAVLFLLSIAMPYVLNPILAPYSDQINHENRALAELPSFSLSSISEYPGLLEAFLNDHLPFKNEFVKAYHLIEIDLFHTSSSSRVALGKNGWLFYRDAGDGNPIGNYRGNHLLSSDELEQIAENMTATKMALEAEGRDFVVFIIPNKERIYSENMPDYYGTPAEIYPVLQIVSYLNEHTDVKVVYPYQSIMEEKARLMETGQELYYRTDTHWNLLGAYIGTRELLQALNIELPALESPEITVEKSKISPGDLSNMLNIGEYIDPGNEYSVSGYNTHEMDDLSEEEYSFTSVGSDERSILMVRDSFATAMRYYIGSQFKKSDLIQWSHFDYDDIRAMDADVFILETVERYAPSRLMGFRYERGVNQTDPKSNREVD